MRIPSRWLVLLLALLGVAQARAAIVATKAVPSSTKPAATKPVDYYALGADEFFKRPEVKERIKKDAVDIALLEAAIFQQTNRERAALKLPLFKHSWACNLMARRHSTEMEALQFFDHFSPTPANHSLADRLKNVGLVNVNAGENIAVLPAKEMGSGTYIIHKNPDGTERWTDEATGKTIDYYTYEDLSATVLKQWMNSPPHHENIVNRVYVYLGVGVARGNYDKGQDSFYMTQNFSGSINAGETKAQKELAAATRPAP